MEFEDAEGFDIDTLLKKYGGEEFNNRLLTYFTKNIRMANHTIFASPARIMDDKNFWEVTRLNGISIHLQGKPMEVYMRQDMWVNGKKLTKNEKLNDQWKQNFYDYYEWRLTHCQKADHTVRIIGNKRTDTKNLCKMIAELTPIQNSEKECCSKLVN